MESLKFTEQFKTLFESASAVAAFYDAKLLLLLEGEVDWTRLRKLAQNRKVIVVAGKEEFLEGAAEQHFMPILINTQYTNSAFDRISHSILESLADDHLSAGSSVVALYSGIDPNAIDSITVIHLGEHLDRLTGRDLRKIETKVPLKTLKSVVDLALEIGREGREGKMVGTLFVVGDSKNVMEQSKPAGFDPVRGYQRHECNLCDKRVQEGIKEISQLDGAFVVAVDGTVEAACRYLESSNTALCTVAKGLGARHWAAASISSTTNAVSVAVSQSSGTVRIFVNGEVALRIEARHRNPLVWRLADE